MASAFQRGGFDDNPVADALQLRRRNYFLKEHFAIFSRCSDVELVFHPSI